MKDSASKKFKIALACDALATSISSARAADLTVSGCTTVFLVRRETSWGASARRNADGARNMTLGSRVQSACRRR